MHWACVRVSSAPRSIGGEASAGGGRPPARPPPDRGWRWRRRRRPRPVASGGCAARARRALPRQRPRTRPQRALARRQRRNLERRRRWPASSGAGTGAAVRDTHMQMRCASRGRVRGGHGVHGHACRCRAHRGRTYRPPPCRLALPEDAEGHDLWAAGQRAIGPRVAASGRCMDGRPAGRRRAPATREGIGVCVRGKRGRKRAPAPYAMPANVARRRPARQRRTPAQSTAQPCRLPAARVQHPPLGVARRPARGG